jgi:hypothetical protein
VDEGCVAEHLYQFRQHGSRESIGHVVGEYRRQTVQFGDLRQRQDVGAEAHRIDVANAGHDGGLMIDEHHRRVVRRDEFAVWVVAVVFASHEGFLLVV